MMNKFDLIITRGSLFLIIVLFSKEAWVSQLFINEEAYDLSVVVKNVDEIWVAKDLKKSEVTKKVVFPKETHHSKREATTFAENGRRYLLQEPLKTAGELKPGSSILLVLRSENAYGEDSFRRFHEIGESESPIVNVYKSKYKVEDSKEYKAGDSKVVLFFSKNHQNENIYKAPGDLIEGVGIVPEITKLISSKSVKK
jgi:hypothetical protein